MDGSTCSRPWPRASSSRSVSGKPADVAKSIRIISPLLSNTGRQPPPSELIVKSGRGAALFVIPLPGIRRRPGIFVIGHRKCRDIHHHILKAQCAGFLEQALPAIDVRGVKYPWRQFSFSKETPDQRQAARPVTQVQMKHAGLAAEQACHMNI